MITPLCVEQQRSIDQNNYVLNFAVRKINPYVVGRAITIPEAIYCVVCQSRWATSHEVLSKSLGGSKDISIDVLFGQSITGIGKFVKVKVMKNDRSHHCDFLVSESDTHWFVKDLNLINVAPVKEL